VKTCFPRCLSPARAAARPGKRRGLFERLLVRWCVQAFTTAFEGTSAVLARFEAQRASLSAAMVVARGNPAAGLQALAVFCAPFEGSAASCVSGRMAASWAPIQVAAIMAAVPTSTAFRWP